MRILINVYETMGMLAIEVSSDDERTDWPSQPVHVWRRSWIQQGARSGEDLLDTLRDTAAELYNLAYDEE